MKILIYSLAAFSVLCLTCHFVFESLMWPSIFNFLLSAIISMILCLGLIGFMSIKNVFGRIILSFSVVVTIVTAIGVFEVSNILRNSEPYLLTIQSLKSNDLIVKRVGGDFKESLLVAGELSGGKSFFSFAIKGNGKRIKVYSTVEMDKDGDWEIIKMEYGY